MSDLLGCQEVRHLLLAHLGTDFRQLVFLDKMCKRASLVSFWTKRLIVPKVTQPSEGDHIASESIISDPSVLNPLSFSPPPCKNCKSAEQFASKLPNFE